MSVQIVSASLISDEALHELIIQSLEKLPGPDHELIAPKLPCDGHHILAASKDSGCFFYHVTIIFDSSNRFPWITATIRMFFTRIR